MEKLINAKSTQSSQLLNKPLSGAELQRQIGHGMRSPLTHILDHTDSILSSEASLPSEFRDEVGFISSEARRALGLYDCTLILFELTLNPEIGSRMDSTAFLSFFYREIENNVPTELLGYRIIWHVPTGLPPILCHKALLQQALHLMMRLLGHDFHSPYIQLDAQVLASELAFQIHAVLTDTVIPKLDFEYAFLAVVAGVFGGRFECVLNDQNLSLNLYLPIAT